MSDPRILTNEQITEAFDAIAEGAGAYPLGGRVAIWGHIEALNERIEAADALAEALQRFWDTAHDNRTDDPDQWWHVHDEATDALVAAQDAYRATAGDDD